MNTKKHLKKYGENISTELIFETHDKEKFKKHALKISKKYNIVKDKGWANEIFEQGDGGDTVSYRKWITDGLVDKYILKTENIPSGWRRGRGSKCVFNDVKKGLTKSKEMQLGIQGFNTEPLVVKFLLKGFVKASSLLVGVKNEDI